MIVSYIEVNDETRLDGEGPSRRVMSGVADAGPGRLTLQRWVVLQQVHLEGCPRVTIGWAPLSVHCKRSLLTDSENGAFKAGDTF